MPVEPVDAAAVLPGFDAKIAVGDTKAGGDGAKTGDAASPIDVPLDTAAAVTPTGLALDASAALECGARVALQVTVTRSDGASGLPKAGESILFTVDGLPIEVGSMLSADPVQQAKIAVWKDSKTGAFWLAGLRPGPAKLGASVAGVVAEERDVDVSFPTGSLLRLAAIGGSGTSPGDRVLDSADTIKFEGKKFGAGGLTITLRFPSAAVSGDIFDLDKPSKVGGALQLVATVSDMGNIQLKVPLGRIFVDQTDKGWFRGTFLGTSASLQPVAGVFAVERDGKFGIDLLDTAQQVATSTTPKWNQTGTHVSRVSISAVPGSQALVHWREVHDVTTADIVRLVIDAKTGQTTALGPLVVKAIAAVLVDNGSETLVPKQKGEFFGSAAVATSQGKTLVVWEGKSAKGSAAPYQISAQVLDAKLAPVGTPVQVAPDECWGECKPQLVALPSSRWMAVWGAPAGAGVRAAILDGNDLSQPEKLVTLVTAPAINPSVAVLDANVAVVWRSPGKGSRFRLYSDTLASNGPEQDLGVPTANPPPPGIAAIENPPSFVATFFSPAVELKLRRIGLNASLIGPGDVAVASGIARIAVAAGKYGQVAVVERVSGAGPGEPQLRLRKLVVASPGDPGAALGLAVALEASASKVILDAALTYVPEAGVFIVTWSGDATSDGVWIQRFR